MLYSIGMQEQNLPNPVTSEAPVLPVVETVPTQNLQEQMSNNPQKIEKTPAKGDVVGQAGPVLQYSTTDLPQPIVVDPRDVPVADDIGIQLPAVADDIDVIEKIWVDKAKTIVQQTKNDPYLQEKQVSILQEDYKKKRYGKAEDSR